MRTLVVLAVCACRSPAPPAVAPAPAAEARELSSKPFAVPDEEMEFRTSVRGVSVGLVQTAIGRPGWIGDRRAIIVRSRGKSDGIAALFGEIEWNLSTTIDLERGFPIEDREEAWIALAGDHHHHDASHTWDDGDRRHDVHSVIGVLRGWRSTPGQRTSAEVELGGGRFSVVVSNTGREFLTAAMRPAIRYDGVVHGKLAFAIWVSDDAARVPLAFHLESPIGTVAVELTDYHVAANEL